MFIWVCMYVCMYDFKIFWSDTNTSLFNQWAKQAGKWCLMAFWVGFSNDFLLFFSWCLIQKKKNIFHRRFMIRFYNHLCEVYDTLITVRYCEYAKLFNTYILMKVFVVSPIEFQSQLCLIKVKYESSFCCLNEMKEWMCQTSAWMENQIRNMCHQILRLKINKGEIFEFSILM